MSEQEQSSRELAQKEKRRVEDAESLTREQERKKIYLAKEKIHEDEGKARDASRAGKQKDEESKQLAREAARKQSYLSKEKALAEAEEVRKLKATK